MEPQRNPAAGPPPVSVEVAAASDWARVRSVRLAALASDPLSFGTTWGDAHARPEAWWRDRLTSGTSTTLIAVTDGDVGLSVVAPSGGDPMDAGLYSVWVDPRARGAGVGQALIRTAIRITSDRGCRRLLLEVGDHNAAAIRLYARMGFVPTGNVTTLPPPRDHITEHERVRILAGGGEAWI